MDEAQCLPRWKRSFPMGWNPYLAKEIKEVYPNA